LASISYQSGYKYQLAKTYRCRIEITPAKAIKTPYIKLATDGLMTINKGYAWDGPSGPTIDTKNFMRGSLIHDALYQLMRGKHLDHTLWRRGADDILRRICLEDGMSTARAWWVWEAVRFGGGSSADPAKDKHILTAP
jgi:hypothetical protein